MRALRHRDFRVLWLGALFSFTGSWIQSVAQSWLVYELTGDRSKLGLVMFCASAPVALVGPLAGTLADTFDKRRVLIFMQLGFAVGALVLASAIQFNFISYELILLIATLNGFYSAIEMPTRQSIISKVVPVEDLPSAIPLQAMTFNLARVVGPSIGGLLLAALGPKVCYFTNGLSYIGLIASALAIKTDLGSVRQEAEGIRELIAEGIRFTFTDIRLRTLFLMEALVSACGLVYIALMPSLAKDKLRVSEQGLGNMYTAVGVGAVIGLLIVANQKSTMTRAQIVRIAMSSMGICMVALSFIDQIVPSYILLGLLGMSSIMQFNTTNTLFQLIAPERLRGRVIAMHMWALSGVGPFGTLFFSWFAQHFGIDPTLRVGGALIVLGALWGWSQSATFKELKRPIDELLSHPRMATDSGDEPESNTPGSRTT